MKRTANLMSSALHTCIFFGCVHECGVSKKEVVANCLFGGVRDHCNALLCGGFLPHFRENLETNTQSAHVLRTNHVSVCAIQKQKGGWIRAKTSESNYSL